MSRLEDQESPSQRETGGCCLGLRRKVGLKAVHVYSQIPERTSHPLRFRKEARRGRKEMARPHQRPEETGRFCLMDTSQGSQMCVVRSSLIKTLVADIAGFESGHRVSVTAHWKVG